ncbi:MAG: NifB/NifX family molybdenum-iron cluster-binding protein [Succinivibrionaceae bacterium]|nr:NifB/NifX family molybdenum-iron cluster-binding protein [Succinivibrionaceae bacterium]
MRVAAAYDNGNVFPHFGMTSEFKFYEIEDGKVVSTEIRDTGGAKHRDIVFFLKDSGVDTLICGGIGGCGQRLLAENGIRLFGGVSGNADEAVEKLIAGTLECGRLDTGCCHHDHAYDDAEKN